MTKTDPTAAVPPVIPNLCARHVLNIAAELEADETGIKHEIIAAAEAGDCAEVIRITNAWINCPPSEILARLRMPKDRRKPLNPGKAPQ